MSLEIGSTLGDYQIIGVLGAGGMGRVYKVRNVISDRIEAMKVLLPDLATAPELADRFMREIKVQASLEHPNIAALHTAVRVENQLLMLMEYLEGMTLEQRLQQGRLPVGEAVEYVRQALGALDYAHQRGVIHRDIKPANMMVVGAGTLKLMDFGIAKASGDQRLTMTGTTMGSLYYMSPEQIKGAADLDARADLYSVGVSLYELVTGKRPFDGDSQFAIMSAHLEKTPVPPVSIDPGLPESLNDLILMSVSKEPGQRFQTAGAFRNALGSFAAATAAPTATMVSAPRPAMTAPVPIVSPPPPQGAPPFAAPQQPQNYHLIEPRQPAPPHGKRGLWMALGAVAAVLAAVAVIQFAPWKSSKAAPEPTASVPANPAPQPPAQQAPPQAPPSQPAASQPASPAPQSAGQAPSAPASPHAAEPAPVQKPSATKVAHQVVPRTTEPAPSQPLAPAPVTPQQPAAQASAPQSAAQAPAPVASPHAEVMEFRERLMMLTTRAQGIRVSLKTLKDQQAASGLNLRGDMQEALDMMNVYMQGAHNALNAGDLPASRTLADKGERQIEKLEKFLNR